MPLFLMKPMIEVENICKAYFKGLDKRYKSLRESIVHIPKNIFNSQRKPFWALEDINFHVTEGQSFGIIGPNGAGKSTLLKILSRITPPTKGKITMYGRVASLLEVGTGFHPELTGRENVYFNGSILGMKKSEIRQRFDEIVAFSGVEEFLDSPLKHYSSGMQMRLAFSVAAHLRAEILLIDEVLAVGDVAFQKKCIGKMDEVSKGQGKTILFVSHDMSALLNFCPHGMLLESGKIKEIGPMDQVVSSYLSNKSFTNRLDSDVVQRQGNGKLTFTNIEIQSIQNANLGLIKCGEDVAIHVYFKTEKDYGSNVFFAILIDNILGQRVAVMSNEMLQKELIFDQTNHCISLKIPHFPMPPGIYTVTLYCTIQGQIADWVKNVCEFEVTGGDFYQTGHNIPKHAGLTLLDFSLDIS